MEPHCKAFAELTAAELYALMSLRQRVFVVEQACAYLDADGHDQVCHHLWLGDPCLAALRIVPPGEKYPEVSIGRVVTALEVRRTGLGRVLMREGLAAVARIHGAAPIRISAQAYLERFYGELGFARVSADYDEDGIPHCEMLRPVG
ncbi:MAG: GNAT family N-acetyltransferase [Myxococcales bacterium]|nr:GNAT family N-acetyltransferase [Myxococcales bacterium]